MSADFGAPRLKFEGKSLKSRRGAIGQHDVITPETERFEL
jgi:hypothetical protein